MLRLLAIRERRRTCDARSRFDEAKRQEPRPMLAVLATLYLVACLVVFALTPASAVAQETLRGVALVIGQSEYTGLTPLANPENDARALDDMLDDLGFDVTRVLDADHEELAEELADFAKEAAEADVAFVYYSGHGIEAGGENYLIPVDADVSSAERAGDKLIPLSGLLDELAKTVPVTIFLLDACRTNSFPPGQMVQLPGATAPIPVSSEGLGAKRGELFTQAVGTEETFGTVLGFAAAPGRAALDGEPGGNSPYAAALLKHIGSSGYAFGDVMTMVSEEVYLETRARQLPWVNSSLRRFLSFGDPIEDSGTDEALIREGRRALLMTIAAAPPETRAFVEATATDEDVPLDALYGMLKVLGVDTSGGAANLEQQLLQGAQQLRTFMESAPGGVKTDTELVRLSDLADRAQAEGAIDVALHFREQATARARSLSSERDQLEEQLKTDRLEIASTYAEHAETAAINFDYVTAAGLFADAFEEVARWDDAAALDYKWRQADMLASAGRGSGAMDQLLASERAYGEALARAPREADPKSWGVIQNNLGVMLISLGEREGGTAGLQRALAALGAASEVLTVETAPVEWARLQANAGVALVELGKREGSIERFHQALDAYAAAVAVFRAQKEVVAWAATQGNAGMVLNEIGQVTQDRNVLADAVATFEETLAIPGYREAAPYDWANANNNMGNALLNLGTLEENAQYFDAAAAAFTRALEERRRDRMPQDWAGTQSNLGAALARLGEMTRNVAVLEQAIESFRAALEVQTREVVPIDWGRTQGNVATTLGIIARLANDPDALVASIEAYREALTELTRERSPIAHARMQGNLGNALSDLGWYRGDANLIVQAIEAWQAMSLDVNEQFAPIEWAGTQNKIGLALVAITPPEAGTANIEAAIEIYRGALRGVPREALPSAWAEVTYNLAVALRTLGERTTGIEALQQAMEAYQASAEVRTRDADLATWARTSEELGVTIFLLGQRIGSREAVVAGREWVVAARDAYIESGDATAEDYFGGQLAQMDAVIEAMPQGKVLPESGEGTSMGQFR